MNDREYIFKTLQGDKEAYGRLIDSYQGMVFAVALNITGNYSDSEDLVQDIFLDAYRKLRTLSNPSNFGSWLYTIAKRAALMFLRKKRKQAHISIEEPGLDQVLSKAELAVERFARKEFNTLVWKQVDDLPNKPREAILLYYMEGFSIKRAAAFLKISENAMKKRLHFGRIKIRENLTEEIEVELRRYPPSQKNRNYILAALPAGGVPKLGLLGSLATKGGLTMAAISSKKIAIVAAVIIVGAITTVTIRQNLPKAPSPTPPIISEKNENDNDRIVKKKAGTKPQKHKDQTPAESKNTWNISGKVQDDQDNLVSGAEIKLQIAKTMERLQVVDSDTQGMFKLENLKEDLLYTIVAEHPDYYSERVENIRANSVPLVIIFKTGALAFGRVVDFDKKAY